MQVLHEETLEAVLALLRFHLMNNVLAFHDVYLQRQHRPTLAEGLPFLLQCCAHQAAHPAATTKPVVLLTCRLHGRSNRGQGARQGQTSGWAGALVSLLFLCCCTVLTVQHAAFRSKTLRSALINMFHCLPVYAAPRRGP